MRDLLGRELNVVCEDNNLTISLSTSDIEIIKDVLNQETNYGFSLVIFSERIQNLPSECHNFISVEREKSGMFESEIATDKKTKAWPIAIIFGLFAIIGILAYFPWVDAFKIEIFTKALDAIKTFEVFDSTVFAYILGSVQAFGSWDLFGIQVLMVIATLLVKWIYKIDFNDYIDKFYVKIPMSFQT